MGKYWVVDKTLNLDRLLKRYNKMEVFQSTLGKPLKSGLYYET